MKNIISIIKSNWPTILLLIAVGLLTWRLYFFTDTYEFILDENAKQSELFHKQLLEIEKVNEQLKKDQEQLEKNYQKDILSLMTDYTNKIDELSKLKKTNQSKIIKDAKENPQTLTKKIEEVFGIPTEE